MVGPVLRLGLLLIEQGDLVRKLGCANDLLAAYLSGLQLLLARSRVPIGRSDPGQRRAHDPEREA